MVRKIIAWEEPISSSSIGINETESQVLPVDTEDFEIAVRKVCELIKHNDSRIGRIPKPRQTRLKAKNINKSGKLFPWYSWILKIYIGMNLEICNFDIASNHT